MLSIYQTDSQFENSQYGQLMKSFLQFYPDLAICTAKNGAMTSEKANNKRGDLTMIRQIGRQLKFSNPQFLLDDCLNSMYCRLCILGRY